ncbi:MAG: NUDIX domain-containing protein [Candidatus Methylomirabilales bacterium]
MFAIRDLVTYYLQGFPEENDRLRQLHDLLNNTPDESALRSRKNFVGHITASAFVVHRKTRKVLRILHKQLRMYLQPGGHFQAGEMNPLAVALREVKEETSLGDLVHVPYHYNSDVPIDIDSHYIPADAQKNEPEHYHHDFRYLFLTEADEDAPAIQESEAFAYDWDEIRELQRLQTFTSIADKIERVLGRELRQRRFYDKICQALQPVERAKAIVITHILPDVPEYLSAINNIADVIAVIPKPKSIVREVLQKMQTKFDILHLTRDELRNIEVATSLVDRSHNDRIVIFDIGGWFAPVINELATSRPGKVLGVIEDTENGHRKYAELQEVKVPVVSVARSPLKDNEDLLVGQSVLFSADAILRECGRLIQYLNCSVLGYGKIGSSIADHLLLRGVKPNVFDTNPVRRIAAYNRLCNIPSRGELLGSSDVIFSATGSQAANIIDFRSLKNGCFVFSVTSSDDEFDLSYVNAEYQRQEVAPYVQKYWSFSNYFYLVNSGNAVNFLHKAVLGDFIHLVRAEMLVAYRILVGGTFQPGIHSVDAPWREAVARSWLSTMLDVWEEP